MRRRLLSSLVLAGLLFVAGCESEDGWVRVQNDLAVDLVAVFIDPCGEPTRTSEVLRGGRIVPGEDEAFSVEYGCYNVAVTTDDGRSGQWTVDVEDGRRIVTVIAEE